MNVRRNCLLLFALVLPLFADGQVTASVVVSTNTTIRVMAANLTSGSNQEYETPGLNIMKGLKPDVVAIQEFNYAGSLRTMVNNTFGTNFSYYCETGKNIPNGIISRYPILASGFWDDAELSDREFAWARLDIPGTNDLYVVSVHLKAQADSTSKARRANQANALKGYVQTNFPANAWVIVAGDMNISDPSETALATFKTFLSDSPIPTDATSGGNPNTNAGRAERYDYVFANFNFSTNRVATVIGAKTFTNGLVFDSRVYSPLSDVSPVVFGDSGAEFMQHMAVVKDFRITYTTTNFVTVPSPRLSLIGTNILRWTGPSNVTYSVQSSTNLPTWLPLGTASSPTTNISFTNASPGPLRRFYRVLYP